MGKGQLFHQRTDVISLRDIGLQKFAPGRHIVEQVPDQKGGSLRRPHLLHLFLLASGDQIPDPADSAGSPRDQLHGGHGGNAGKSLPAESERRNMHQIIHRTDLAGGMAQKSGPDLVRFNPCPVVRDPDQLLSAVGNFHGHRRRASIDGILHQLLHHRGRTFHHLTGSDLVDGTLVKKFYPAHICILSVPPEDPL